MKTAHAPQTSNGRPSARRRTLSPVAVASGVLVTLGGMALLGSVVGMALATGGFRTTDLVRPDSNLVRALSAAIVVTLPLFTGLWGGYTAGRMGRDRGLLHGLLVGVGALLAVAATTIGVESVLGVPDRILSIVTGSRFPGYVAAAGAAAALIGATVGGLAGSRWHRRFDGIEEHLPSHVRVLEGSRG